MLDASAKKVLRLVKSVREFTTGYAEELPDTEGLEEDAKRLNVFAEMNLPFAAGVDSDKGNSRTLTRADRPSIRSGAAVGNQTG